MTEPTNHEDNQTRERTCYGLRDRIRHRQDYRRLVLIATLFGTAAGSYSVTVLSASLPRIARDLGTTDDTITWVIVGIVMAILLLIGAILTRPDDGQRVRPGVPIDLIRRLFR